MGLTRRSDCSFTSSRAERSAAVPVPAPAAMRSRSRQRASRAQQRVLATTLLLGTVAALCCHPCAADIIACEPPVNMVARCGGKRYDLSRMKTSSGGGTFTTSNAEYTFSVRLNSGGVDVSKLTCDFPPQTTDVGAVQVRKDGGGCYSLGTAASQSWSLDTVAKTITIKMTGGTDGRASAVEVACDPSATTASVTYNGQNLSGYSFTMSHKGACDVTETSSTTTTQTTTTTKMTTKTTTTTAHWRTTTTTTTTPPHPHPGSGSGCLQESILFPTDHDTATDLVTVDLDLDGDDDVVVASSGDGKIAWYENTDGKGTFSDQHIITSATGKPRTIQVGDVNRDGFYDIVFDYSPIELMWIPGTGKGTFSSPRSLKYGLHSLSTFVLYDLNQDGLLDVIAGESEPASIVWFKNKGGTFAQAAAISGAGDLSSVSAILPSFVNADGEPDLVVADEVGNAVYWLENKGSALRFVRHVISQNIELPTDLSYGRRIGVVVTSMRTKAVSFIGISGYLNSPQFLDPIVLTAASDFESTYDTISGPAKLMSPLNYDDELTVFVPCETAVGIFTAYDNGQPTFKYRSYSALVDKYSWSRSGLDGILTHITLLPRHLLGRKAMQVVGLRTRRSYSVLITATIHDAIDPPRSSNTTAALPLQFPTNAARLPTSTVPVITDLDMNGKVDMVAFSDSLDSIFIFPDIDHTTSVDDSIAVVTKLGNCDYVSVLVAHIGAEVGASPGIVYSCSFSDRTQRSFVNFIPYKGAGKVGPLVSLVANAARDVYQYWAADINGDFLVDLVGLTDSDELFWYKNKGGFAFDPRQRNIQTDGDVGSVFLQDMTGNGVKDIILTENDNFRTNVSVMINHGKGQFTTKQVEALGSATHFSPITVADFNNDGISDIAVGHYSAEPTIMIFLNKGDGSFGNEPDSVYPIPAALPGLSYLKVAGITSCSVEANGGNDIIFSLYDSDIAEYGVYWMKNLNDGTGTFLQPTYFKNAENIWRNSANLAYFCSVPATKDDTNFTPELYRVGYGSPLALMRPSTSAYDPSTNQCRGTTFARGNPPMNADTTTKTPQRALYAQRTSPVFTSSSQNDSGPLSTTVVAILCATVAVVAIAVIIIVVVLSRARGKAARLNRNRRDGHARSSGSHPSSPYDDGASDTEAVGSDDEPLLGP